MKKELTPTYWVLTEKEEKTVATTYHEEYALWIAKNFPEKCIIRVTFS